MSLSSEYHLFEFPRTADKENAQTLDLSATLVHSEYEHFENNNPNDPKSFYEFVEIAIKSDKFSKVEAKLKADILLRVNLREF